MIIIILINATNLFCFRNTESIPHSTKIVHESDSAWSEQVDII